MRKSIYIVHEGKAAYPDVAAIGTYFAPAFDTTIVDPKSVRSAPALESSICWHMMGFYPRRAPAKLVVHDYRSLSVGRMRRFKDLMKRVGNANPDIRVFQNDEIRTSFYFPKDERTFYLPMGVPDLFVDRRETAAVRHCDFVYIGAMLGERRCDLMLDSFLKRFGATKLFKLYGPRNPELEARYRDHANIQFCGKVPQDDLVSILKGAHVGVAYFPNHFPHVLQTPTKLMEYAALGMRILANEQPQNRITAAQYGVDCLWGPADDMFAGVPDALDWADNAALDVEPMRWSSVIEKSGLPSAIAASFP